MLKFCRKKHIAQNKSKKLRINAQSLEKFCLKYSHLWSRRKAKSLVKNQNKGTSACFTSYCITDVRDNKDI